MGKYRLLDVSLMDAKIITSEPREEDWSIETPKQERGRHNELATVAILGGIHLLTIAAAYYFGKRETEEVNLLVEEVGSDGRLRRVALSINKSKTEPIETQIISQLRDVLKE